MHPLHTSREQDLAASPKHQALLKNLSILAKSQAHASLLASTIRQGSNDHAHAKAPANVHSVIARSAVSDIDREAERKYGERMTALQRQRAKRGGGHQEAEQLRRMSEARTNGGINDEDDEKIGADRVPVTRGTKCAKGSFDRLKKSLAGKVGDSIETVMKALQSTYAPHVSVAKALAEQDASGEGFERYGDGFTPSGVAHAVAVKAIRATVKPSTPAKPTLATIRKSLDKAASLMKSMGLEVSYDSNSATLTGGDAIRKQSMAGAKRKPKYSADQILKAASAALHAGAISGADAQAIQHQVNLRGTCDEALLKKLCGEDSSDAPATLNDSQVRDACMKGMQTGAVTAAEAMHCDVALSLNQPIDGGLMDRLRQIHIIK
jgi:hypothetical protein